MQEFTKSNMADSTASTSLIDLVTHDWKQINLPSLRTELDDKLMEFDRISKENKQHRKVLSQILTINDDAFIIFP